MSCCLRRSWPTSWGTTWESSTTTQPAPVTLSTSASCTRISPRTVASATAALTTSTVSSMTTEGPACLTSLGTKAASSEMSVVGTVWWRSQRSVTVVIAVPITNVVMKTVNLRRVQNVIMSFAVFNVNLKRRDRFVVLLMEFVT
ncbi:hypothetical protein LEMLEM_LOCUS20510 [Lemmus lemmus]